MEKNVKFSITYQAESLEEFESLVIKYGNQIIPPLHPLILQGEKMQGEKANTAGENEMAYKAKYGQTRLTEKMVNLFDLTGDKEAQFLKFKTLRDEGKAVKTVTGYVLADETPDEEPVPENESGRDVFS